MTYTAADIQSELHQLYLERALADSQGLTDNVPYMADLETDIAAHRAAYIGAAVTEIATLRAELSGPLQG